MILECSDCGARYLLPDSVVGANGRKVRCVRCGNVWHARLRTLDLTTPLLSLPPGRTFAFRGPLAPQPRPRWEPPTGPELADAFRRLIGLEGFYHAGFRPRRDPARLMNILAVGIFVVLLSLAAAVLEWTPPVTAAPAPSADSARSPGGAASATPLRISLLGRPASTLMASGDVLFAISARVSNPSSIIQPVPVVVVQLRDGSGRPIYGWTIHSPRSRLGPGEAVDMDSSQIDVPPGAKSLTLGFMLDGSHVRASPLRRNVT